MIATLNGIRNTDLQMDFTHKEISEAVEKRVTVSVPLADGLLDLTDALSSRPRFEARTVLMEFEIRADRDEWSLIMAELNTRYNGQIVQVGFSDDPEWYWEGRASVGKMEDRISTAHVAISVSAFPYKWRTRVDSDGSTAIVGSANLTIKCTDPIGDPEFITAADMTISDGTETWTINSSTTKAYGLRFYQGDNALTVTGTGTLTVKYRGGSL